MSDINITVNDEIVNIDVIDEPVLVNVVNSPGQQGPAGVGVPVGGTTGQILAKASATNYDTEWINNYAKYLATNVRNQSGSTIAAFQVVYISGATGNKPLISLADADTEATSSKTYGVTAVSIANNGTGDVVTAGELSGIDTSAFTEGDSLWLSTTAGGVVTTPPAEPAHAVFIGTVVRSHPTLGVIDVAIANGYELNELHGVLITSAANNQGLFYTSSTGLWENKSIATALGYTPANAATTLTINGVTYDLSANRSWTISAGISGTIATGQVAYGTAANTIGGSNNLFWDAANSRLGVNRATPIVAFDVASSFNGAITPLSVVPDSATAIFLGNTGTNAGLAIGQNNATQSWLQARSRLASQPAYQLLLQPLGGNVLIGTTTDDGTNRLQVSGSVAFGGSTGLKWDDTNKRLGIGTNAPAVKTHIVYSDNTFLNGLYVQNTNTGTNAYSGIGIQDSSGNVLAGFQYVPNTFSAVQLRNTVLFASTQKSKLAFVANSGVIDAIAQDIYFATLGNKTNLYLFGATGNLVLQNGGTFTDDGTNRLQVSGNAKVTGSGNTAASTALTVQNSSGNNLLRVLNNGYVRFGDNASGPFISADGTNTGSLLFYTSGGSNATGAFVFRGDNAGNTSGNNICINISQNFSPSSGTANYSLLSISSTINQTGGANGITRGLYVNPTLTSAADFRAIETANGKVVFGNLPTSSAGLPSGAIWNNGGVLNIV